MLAHMMQHTLAGNMYLDIHAGEGWILLDTFKTNLHTVCIALLHVHPMPPLQTSLKWLWTYDMCQIVH